jgi:hypothetical protein
MNKERGHTWKGLGQTMGIIRKLAGDGEKSGRRRNEERERATGRGTDEEGEAMKSAW